MTNSLRILQEITTGYSIFEKDQVLTESQLNSITNYLNDQTRLTSIYLLGVGVVSGLRVSLSSDAIAVTKGIGITTDGDLLYYSNNTVCDRFILYDKSYPKYAPFYLTSQGSEEEMIAVYEVIPQGVTDSRNPVFPLSQFATETSKDLKNMVAVLLMESYVNDPDICTGTDCDNLGQDCVNTRKLLLVEKKSINLLLKPAIATPDAAFNALNEIVVERPLIGSSITSVSALANVYRTVCSNIHGNIVTEISKIYVNCAAFLTDVFLSDPTSGWVTRLTEIQSAARSDVGIQYYYDFLQDVVESYNQFRDLLFGDNTWCCPDINWFPKHLLLGNLVLISDADPDENRTDFYPSPAISQTAESLNHAKFLVRKLDTLIQTFQIPAVSSAGSVRITPSLFGDHPLEERAIPYYYQVNKTNPIDQYWNYSLRQRGMGRRNYSYNATAYEADGAAANPLTSQIGRFSFFRIEGYLGQKLGTVVSNISQIVKSHNLPFSMLVTVLGQATQPGETDFGDFISQHPGIEHFGGVLRGGTFVLLADAKNETVIADFMLPYYLSPPRNNIVAADGLDSKREQLVKIGYQTVFGSAPGHNARHAALCLRDLAYYLDAIIDSCRQDSTSYLDQFISSMKDLNKSLGYPNNWFIIFYQAIKKNHGLTGETANFANFYLDRAIADLTSYNIEAADGLNNKRDQLIKSGYQAVFGSSPGHSSRQAALCLRDLAYYLDAIINSCRQDSTSYLDQFISSMKEINNSSGYSNNWFVTFYQTVKKNHGLAGEVAKVANSYLDRAIADFDSQPNQ